ncbi:MAG: N-acetyltransferase, partial [Pseudomonadota bacterium]|nr:N-acetyltransferase [Pseudomonadota bacterium]
MLHIVPLAQIDPPLVEQLLDRAFVADRHARTAYRLRAGTAAIPALSFAAMEGGTLVGTVQCWPLVFIADDGDVRPLVMLGPIAVEPERQRDGIGRVLTERAIDAAGAHDDAVALMLIGDPGYYGRFFGFSAARTGGWRVPGPVERHRLLARGAA